MNQKQYDFALEVIRKGLQYTTSPNYLHGTIKTIITINTLIDVISLGLNLNMADVYTILSQPDQAIPYFRAALKLHPEETEILLSIGDAQKYVMMMMIE